LTTADHQIDCTEVSFAPTQRIAQRALPGDEQEVAAITEVISCARLGCPVPELPGS